MKTSLVGTVAGVCVAAAFGMWAIPADAQTPAVKEKPPLYTYVANWAIPRARWAEMEKANAADDRIYAKAIADGTLVGYGDDVSLVHQTDGDTHDRWWSSTSMAGLLKVLDELMSSGSSVADVLSSATKHSDAIYVSRYYNWRAGTWKGVYTHGATYKLKADAPDNAVATLSKTILVPLFEKLLADGTLREYEVDEEAVHTEDPSIFYVFYITATAEGLDKVNAALRQTVEANPLTEPAFSAMVDFSRHRDFLARTNATYK